MVKVKKLLFILSLLLLVVFSFMVNACQKDPEPEGFFMPSFVDISATLSESDGSCILRCTVSSGENISSCGFLFGNSHMDKLKGVFVSDKVFEASVTQYDPGTQYTFQAFISNGTSELKSQTMTWTSPSKTPENPNDQEETDFLTVNAELNQAIMSCHLSCRVNSLEDAESYGFLFGSGSVSRYAGEKSGDNSFDADIEGIEPGTEYFYQAYLIKEGKEYRSDTKSWMLPSDFISSTITINGISVEGKEGGCLLKCSFRSTKPDLIESVGFIFKMAGNYDSKEIQGVIVSDTEFEAFLTGIAPETAYNLTAWMMVAGEYFSSEETTWISPEYESFVKVEATLKQNAGRTVHLECEILSPEGVKDFGFYFHSDQLLYESQKYEGQKNGDNTFFADVGDIESGSTYYLQAYVIKGEYEYRSKVMEWTAPDFNYIVGVEMDFVNGVCHPSCRLHSPSKDSIEEGYFLFGRNESSLKRYDGLLWFNDDDPDGSNLSAAIVSDFVPGDEYEYQAVIFSNGEEVRSDTYIWIVPEDDNEGLFVKIEGHMDETDGTIYILCQLNSNKRIASCGFLFESDKEYWIEDLKANSIEGDSFSFKGPLSFQLDPQREYFIQAYFTDSNEMEYFSYPIKFKFPIEGGAQ